ncbi:Signal recognition particle [Phlyctochytrium bullatum]|nr:Signal recognition particle [Phlyctochytrium bullatum]
MVLVDLGRKLQSALHSLTKETVIDEKVLNALLKDICSALLQADVNAKLVGRLRDNVKKTVNLEELAAGINKRKLIQKAVYDELCRLVDPGVEPFKPKKGKPNIIMFVGLQGAGKTTTCTKLALHYQRKGWKTCLVCTDTFRAGAFDQLKQNATKAKIPFYGSYTETDPVQLAMDGVEKFKKEAFEIILIDTSGRHKQEADLFEEMKQIHSAVKPQNTIFVMDGTIGQAADAQARAFRETVDIGSIIITKMDGHAKGGGAISAVAATNSPIVFIGTGEHMNDLEGFKASQFVSKLLGMGDLSGLLETVKDLSMAENSKDLMKNIEAGVFTLRDMYQQFQNILNMGSMSKMMGLMPGIPQELLQFSDQEGSARIKKFLCMLDSMTEQELDSDGKIFEKEPTRVIRVAKGSGNPVREVEEMLLQCRKFGDVIKTMGGSKGLLKSMEKGGKPNPHALGEMQKQVSKMLPPGMLQQMGGMSGMQNMMQQMMGNLGGLGGMGGMGRGGGGGMPNMESMQQMMQQMMGGGGMGGLGGLGGMGGMGGRGGGASGSKSKGSSTTPPRSTSTERIVGKSSSQLSLKKSKSLYGAQEMASQDLDLPDKGSLGSSVRSLKEAKSSSSKVGSVGDLLADEHPVSGKRSKSMELISDKKPSTVSSTLSVRFETDVFYQSSNDRESSLGTIPKTASPTNSQTGLDKDSARGTPTEQKKKISEWAPGTSLRVICDHKAGDEDELELETGDVVELDATPASDDEYWLRGTNRSLSDRNGQTGFFPASCVELETWEEGAAINAARSEAAATASPSQDDPEEEDEVQEEEPEPEQQDVEIPAPVPPGTKVYCRTSYVREKADEIDLHNGDLIVVLESPEGGWWRGMVGLGGKEARTGWFPATVVEVQQEKTASKPTPVVTSRDSITAPPTVQVAPATPVDSEPPSPTLKATEEPASSPTQAERTKSWYKRLVKKPLGVKEDKDKKAGRGRSHSAPGGTQVGSKSTGSILSFTEEDEENDISLEPVPERHSTTKSRGSEIIKYTDEEHKDYQSLKDAMDKIQGIVAQVNDGARATEGVRKIVEIQTSFIEKINIVTPTRKDWRDKLHLVEQASLRNCRVSDVSEDSNTKHFFELEVLPAGTSTATASSKAKRFLFMATSKQMKMSWLDAYKSVAEAGIRKKHFSETSALDCDLGGQSDEEDRKEDAEGENGGAKVSTANEDKKKKKEEEEAKKKADERAEFEKSIAELKAKLEETEKKLQSAESNIDKLNQDASSLQIGLEESKKREDALKNEISIMQNNLSTANSKITGLENDIKLSSAENATLQKKNASLVETNTQHLQMIQSLKEDIEKLESRKTSLVSSKDQEIERLRRESSERLEKQNQEIERLRKEASERLERVKAEHKAELLAVAAERSADKAMFNSELSSMNAELQRAKEEIEKRSKNFQEESESKVTFLRREAEAKLSRLEQDYELKMMKIQEESKLKIQGLESSLQTATMSHKLEIENKESQLKSLEREKASENQHLTRELEGLKQKATHMTESLKRSLAEAQNMLKANQQDLREKESKLRHREDTLRERESHIAKLEAERSVNCAEIVRLNSAAETLKTDTARTIANLERSLQECHQVVTRKEAEVAEVSQKLHIATDKISVIVAELERLRIENVEKTRIADETISRLREEISQLKIDKSREAERCLHLEKNLRDVSGLYEQARTQQNAFNETNRKYSAELTKLKETCSQQQNSIEKLNTTNTSLQSQLSDAMEKAKAKAAELAELVQKEKAMREQFNLKETEFNKVLLQAERAETRAGELQRSLDRVTKELEREREVKNADIQALKEALKHEAESSRERLNHEMAELKEKMLVEAAERHDNLLKENASLRSRLEREANDIRERRTLEEEMLRTRLDVVERLEKETALNRDKLEKENVELRKQVEEIETEYREKSKAVSIFKKRVKELELENDALVERAQLATDKADELASKYAAADSACRALDGEVSMLKSRIAAAEKESAGLTHRIGMYNELDRRYLELKEETIRISRDAKAYEDELRKTESKDARKAKDLAALMFVIEEISKAVYAVSIPPQLFEDGTKSSPSGPSFSIMVHAATSSTLEDIRLLSVIRKVNEIILSYERLKNELDVERAKAKDVDEVCSAIKKERESYQSSIKRMEHLLKEKTKELGEENVSLRNGVQTLQRELDSTKAEKQKVEALLKEASSRWQAEAGDKEKLDRRLMDAFERIQKMSETHSAELSKYVAQNTQQQKEAELSKAALEESKRKGEELQARVKELESEKSQLQQLNQSLLETKQRLQQLLDNANEVGRNLGLELTRVKTKADELQELLHDKDEAEAEVERLAKTVSTQKVELEQKANQVALLERELKEYLDNTSIEFQRRGAEAAFSLRAAIEAKDTEIRQLQAEISHLNAKFEGLKAKEGELVIQTSRQNKELKQLAFEKDTAEKSVMQCRKEIEVLATKLQFTQRMLEIREKEAQQAVATAAEVNASLLAQRSPSSPQLRRKGLHMLGPEMDEQEIESSTQELVDEIKRYVSTATQASLSFMQNRLINIIAKLGEVENKLRSTANPAQQDATRTPQTLRVPNATPRLAATHPIGSPTSNHRDLHQSPTVLSPDRESISTLFSPTTARGSLEYLVAAAAVSANSRRDQSLELERVRRDVVYSKQAVEDALKNFEIWVLELDSALLKIQSTHNHRLRGIHAAGASPKPSLVPNRQLKAKLFAGETFASPRVLIKGDSEYNLADVFSTLQMEPATRGKSARGSAAQSPRMPRGGERDGAVSCLSMFPGSPDCSFNLAEEMPPSRLMPTSDTPAPM